MSKQKTVPAPVRKPAKSEKVIWVSKDTHAKAVELAYVCRQTMAVVVDEALTAMLAEKNKVANATVDGAGDA